MPDTNIKDLGGSTAFLNGEPKLHSIDEPVYNSFVEHGLPVVIIDDLFSHPEKIAEVVNHQNLVLFTTGQRGEQVRELIGAFEKLNYTPKNVIFISEGTAMSFLDAARKLAEKVDINFYFHDCFDMVTLYEIPWI